MDPVMRQYLAEIGRRGGKTGRRAQSSEEARRMVAVREARRAFRKYCTRCFGSSPPDLVIGATDVAWVAEQLHEHGDREAWETVARLCR